MSGEDERGLDTGDAASVIQLRKRVARERKDQLTDVRRMMEHSNTRRTMWRWLSFCGVFRTSFVPNSDQTIFNEGLRNAGLMMQADLLEACPELYLQMQQENSGATDGQ